MNTLKLEIDFLGGQNLFFTSDTHYGHSNICEGTTNWVIGRQNTSFRKFSSVEDMNTTLCLNINEVVKEDDYLVHLGDWSFGGFEKIEEFRRNLRCKNIILVLGNHDHHIERNKDNVQSLFTKVYSYLDLTVVTPPLTKGVKFPKYYFKCMHYPISSWDKLGDGHIHVHGHTHLSNENRIGRGRVMDVGMDGNDLYPISFKEVYDILHKRPINTHTIHNDHHINL